MTVHRCRGILGYRPLPEQVWRPVRAAAPQVPHPAGRGPVRRPRRGCARPAPRRPHTAARAPRRPPAAAARAPAARCATAARQSHGPSRSRPCSRGGADPHGRDRTILTAVDARRFFQPVDLVVTRGCPGSRRRRSAPARDPLRQYARRAADRWHRSHAAAASPRALR